MSNNLLEPRFWTLPDGTITLQQTSFESDRKKQPLLFDTNASVELNAMRDKIEIILQYIRDTSKAFTQNERTITKI